MRLQKAEQQQVLREIRDDEMLSAVTKATCVERTGERWTVPAFMLITSVRTKFGRVKMEMQSPTNSKALGAVRESLRPLRLNTTGAVAIGRCS
jgi:hypothetical protein